MNIKLFLLMLCVTIFFYPAIGNGYFMLIFAFLPVVNKVPKCVSTNLGRHVAWLCFIFVIIMSSNFSQVPEETNKFLFTMICYFLVGAILKNEFGWQRGYVKIIYIFAFINVIATIMSLIIPDTILSIAKSFYSGETLEKYILMFNNKAYAGISGETSVNA